MNALIAIAGLGIISLAAEIVNLKKYLTIFIALGLLGTLAIVGPEVGLIGEQDMLVFDETTIGVTLLLIVSTVVWLATSSGFLKDEHQTDKTSLVIFVLLGAIIMASYNNMAMLFLGIEILSLSLYVLAGSKKDSLNSIEASFKYFLMGSFATGFLLFGIALIYGATQSFHLPAIIEYVNTHAAEELPGFFYAGVLLMLVGLAFKISAVPFHFWAPDVYDGAPTPVTALMATVVKIAAIAAYGRLFAGGFAELQGPWQLIVKAMIALTLIVPNVTAVFQQRVKKMLAYSSVSNVGYILLLLSTTHSVHSALLYLSAYAAASFAAFTVLMRVENAKANFRGLYKKSPVLAVTMSIALMSLAGIPPLAGFTAKLGVFIFALSANQLALTLLAVGASLLAVYYYFKVIVAMFGESDPDSPQIEVSFTDKLLCVVLSIVLILIGILPALFIY